MPLNDSNLILWQLNLSLDSLAMIIIRCFLKNHCVFLLNANPL